MSDTRTIAAETHLESTRDEDLPDPQFSLDALTTGVYQPFEDDAPGDRTDLIQSIAEDEIRDPILIDREGTVIDGNHRTTLAQQLPAYDEYPEITSIEDIPYRVEVIDEELTETQKHERAIEQNVTRRDHDERVKKKSIRKFIIQLDADGIERDDSKIADLYGVSRPHIVTVRRAVAEEGKLVTSYYLPQSAKRHRIRESIRRNPGATDKEIADRIGVETTRRTVGNVRNDMDDTADENGSDHGRENEHDDDDQRQDQSQSDPDTETKTESETASRPNATPTRNQRQKTRGTPGGEGGGGVDPHRGANRDMSTAALTSRLGEIRARARDDDDATATNGNPVPIGTLTISNQHAREQLTEHGVLVTFRTSRTPTGRVSWTTGHDDDSEGTAIVAQLEIIDPNEDRTLALYQHRSGFESLTAWREAIGELPEKGALYLVAADSD